MNGEDLKKKLLGAGFQPTAIAKKLGITHQAMFARLSANDVKINFITKLCEVTGLSMSYFINVPSPPDVDTLKKMLEQKDELIMKQAEEIGRLKAKIEYIKAAKK